MKRTPRWTIPLAATAVLALVVGLSAGAHELFVHAAEWLERVAGTSGVLGPIVFALLAVVSSLLSPISSGPLVPSAVLAWGRWPTALLLLVGWMVGAAAAWWLGRVGRGTLLAKSERLREVEERVRGLPAKRSFLAALALRVALPSEVGYAYGIVRYPLAPYLAITLLAEIPSALLLVFVSDALLQRRVGLVLTGVGVVVAAVVLVLLWPRHRGRRASHA